MQTAFNLLDTLFRILNRCLVIIAGSLLVFMVLLTCANISLRMVWVPINGTYELMGLTGALMTAFALGYTQRRKGNIAVDVLYKTFPLKVQRFLHIINNVLCLFFFSLATWKIVTWSLKIWRTQEVTETLRIIYYPFSLGVALGCAVLALVFLIDILRALRPSHGE